MAMMMEKKDSKLNSFTNPIVTTAQAAIKPRKNSQIGNRLGERWSPVSGMLDVSEPDILTAGDRLSTVPSTLVKLSILPLSM